MWCYGPSVLKMLPQCNTSVTFILSNPLNIYLCSISKKDFFGFNQFDYLEFFPRYIDYMYIRLDPEQQNKNRSIRHTITE